MLSGIVCSDKTAMKEMAEHSGSGQAEQHSFSRNPPESSRRGRACGLHKNLCIHPLGKSYPLHRSGGAIGALRRPNRRGLPPLANQPACLPGALAQKAPFPARWRKTTELKTYYSLLTIYTFGNVPARSPLPWMLEASVSKRASGNPDLCEKRCSGARGDFLSSVAGGFYFRKVEISLGKVFLKVKSG